MESFVVVLGFQSHIILSAGSKDIHHKNSQTTTRPHSHFHQALPQSELFTVGEDSVSKCIVQSPS